MCNMRGGLVRMEKENARTSDDDLKLLTVWLPAAILEEIILQRFYIRQHWNLIPSIHLAHWLSIVSNSVLSLKA